MEHGVAWMRPLLVAMPRELSVDLVPPAIHAAQHERAGRARERPRRGRLYRWSAVSSRQPAAMAILHGLARRTAPQPQPPRSPMRPVSLAFAGALAPQPQPPRSDVVGVPSTSLRTLTTAHL